MTDEQIIELMARAFAERFCCADGCAYIHDGRKPECDAVVGNGSWTLRVQAAMSFALTALRSAGMAVVPREPTEAMKDAIVDAAQIYDEWGVNKFVSNPMDVYTAMINTAEGKSA